jgi:hypothetical protein
MVSITNTNSNGMNTKNKDNPMVKVSSSKGKTDFSSGFNNYKETCDPHKLPNASSSLAYVQ